VTGASTTSNRNSAAGGYLSHYRDAERDVAWLLDQLADRDARIAELEARLARNEWRFIPAVLRKHRNANQVTYES
jgi:hypothetical protein